MAMLNNQRYKHCTNADCFWSSGVTDLTDLGRPTPQNGLPFGSRQLPLEMCDTRGFPARLMT
jgi:hypothetical protein